MATVVRSAVSADSWVQSAAQRGCWGSSWGVGSSGGSGFQARYSRALQQIYSDHEISRLEGFMSWLTPLYSFCQATIQVSLITTLVMTNSLAELGLEENLL